MTIQGSPLNNEKSGISGNDFIALSNNILHDRTILHRFHISAHRTDIGRTDMVLCNIQNKEKVFTYSKDNNRNMPVGGSGIFSRFPLYYLYARIMKG